MTGMAYDVVHSFRMTLFPHLIFCFVVGSVHWTACVISVECSRPSRLPLARNRLTAGIGSIRVPLLLKTFGPTSSVHLAASNKMVCRREEVRGQRTSRLHDSAGSKIYPGFVFSRLIYLSMIAGDRQGVCKPMQR
jgi:hypothetical protein